MRLSPITLGEDTPSQEVTHRRRNAGYLELDKMICSSQKVILRVVKI